MSDIPKNLEAQRRIAFFGNSLFMNMPHAPPVERMLGFSVLTPYFEETVLYSKASLQKKTKDGLSVLSYLEHVFPDEWKNFKERMQRERGVKHDHELWNLDKSMDVRLWASYRGQTLARTVRGMMYYHKALKVLAYLDGASQMEMQEGRELLAASTIRTEAAADSSLPYSSSQHWVVNRTRSGIGGLLKEAQQEAIASMKFTYVVTCQVYGQQKTKKNPIADDILFLMKKNKALRIAYVDDVNAGGRFKQHFSVIVKYDSLLEKEVEIFRVQLPGPIKLGEGKPENQNHALIFTRGDALQTIDMNQDNYFEEALKARNLLQEFTVHHGLRKPQILGVREHIFTGTVSSSASFMSAQETSFVTLGQRVLANPLKVRMHYGHPDVFDRLWFATRGGISKASSKINVSEDIYAGFNCTLRGGNVTHHEYIQAGKGRDLGLSQIAIFESKVAGGNGEQVLSRDVYRLGHHLDFFHMLSFYYTTVGFFISNMMVVFTVYAFLWGRVYLALSGLEKSVASQGAAFTNRALTASLNQQFIVQLGIFTALPMIVENSIEHGFRSAVWDFLTMQMQLASVFFTFSLGTRAHYFGRTVLHGGAGYRATGRGFVLKHEKFYRTYMLFARSHFVKGVELIVLLVIYQCFGAAGAASTTAYILITFSSWFLALSWVLGPFLFNTLGFDSLKLFRDFDDFWDWMWDKKAIKYKDAKQEEEETWEKYNANPKRGWHIWWDKEHEHLKNTGFWGAVLEIVLSLRFFFLQYGVVYQLNIADQHKSILVYILSWIYMAVVAVIYMILYFAAKRFAVKKHLYYRLVQALTTVFIIVVIIILAAETSFEIGDALLSLLAFLPAGWGLLSIALVFRRFLERTPLWQVLVSTARLFDLTIGILLFVPLLVVSWIPGFQDMQNRILFNQAFSRGLNITLLLAANKPENQEESEKNQ
ncbi:hypothetical protein L7F22_050530 [Adiantum nelumboides]|nr:hypothetical protein [Adiantum nelumboides]